MLDAVCTANTPAVCSCSPPILCLTFCLTQTCSYSIDPHNASKNATGMMTSGEICVWWWGIT